HRTARRPPSLGKPKPCSRVWVVLGPNDTRMSRSAYGDRPMLVQHCSIAEGSFISSREGKPVSAGGRTRVKQRVEDVLDTDEAKGLLEAGKESGSISAEDIALAFDDLELDAGQLGDFYLALEERHIGVL